MFAKKDSTREDIQLTLHIDELYTHLSTFSGEDKEYAEIVDQLTKLYALKEDTSKRRVSPDTLAMVAGNLLGIILIVGHERAHVVTSKALSFVLKLR